MAGVAAAAVVAHVPTLGLAQNTPDYQQGLVVAERALGQSLRRHIEPDLWVIASAHWVATFDWLATCQPLHEGVCVAQEAPSLIPGSAYRYRGDPDFAGALVECILGEGIPAARNDSASYAWDYGTFVPLQHLDPAAECAVVCLPSVLLASHDECLRVGELVHETAVRLGRRAVFLASTAFSHVLRRGRQHWPTPERIEQDRRFIDSLLAGRFDALIDGLADYNRLAGAEMGGRPLATLLGVVRAMQAQAEPAGGHVAGRQHGGYVQSSGSGNAVVVLADSRTLAVLG